MTLALKRAFSAFPLIIAALVSAGCSAAVATTAPSEEWIAFGGSWSAERIVPAGGGFTHDVDDGGVPEFRIALPGANVRDADRGSALAKIDATDLQEAGAGADATNLRAIAGLRLPAAADTSLDAYGRHGAALRWGRERVLRARSLALTVDLRSDSISAAAQLCRGIELDTPPEATAENCTIEAITDLSDGWPLLARMSRSAANASGARLVRSVTFIRTEESLGSTARPPLRN